MSEENVERVRQSFEAFNRRDFDAALVSAADDFTWEPFLSQTETPLLRGKAEVKRAWESQVELLDLRIEPQEFIAVGADKVVATARLLVQGKGSGVSLAHQAAFVTELDCYGRITHVAAYGSPDEALKAAGLLE